MDAVASRTTCLKCGAELNSAMARCRQCGTRVVREEDPAVAASPEVAGPAPSPIPSGTVEGSCPNCGAGIVQGMASCRRCRFDLRPAANSASSRPTEEPLPADVELGAWFEQIAGSAPPVLESDGPATNGVPPLATGGSRPYAALPEAPVAPVPVGPAPFERPSTGYVPSPIGARVSSERPEASAVDGPIPSPTDSAAGAGAPTPGTRDLDEILDRGSTVLDRPSTPSDAGSPGRIRVKCGCGAKFRVGTQLAGKQIACPKCRGTVAVPSESPAATETGASGAAEVPSPVDASAEKTLRLIAARLRAEPAADRTVERRRTLSRMKFSRLKSTATTRASGGGGKTEEARRMKERREAILALGRSGDSRALEIVTGLLGDRDTSVRAAAIEAAGELGAVELLPELIELLVEPVPDLVRAACQALVKIGDRRTVRALVLLGLYEPHVKYLTSKSILDMGEAAAPALIEMLDDSDAGTVLEAVVLLGRIREQKAVRPLVLLIERSVAVVRAHAAEALGQIGDTQAAGVLARLLQDKDAGVRVNAAAALAKMPNPTVLRPLLKALSDGDSDVRLEVVQALGELGSAEAAEPLAELLASGDGAERAAVAEALGKIGDPRAVEPLLELVAADQEGTQVRAIGALRKFRDPRAVEALLNLVEHPKPAVRARSVDTLGSIGSKTIVARLAQILKTDRAAEVRCAAARALGELGDPSAIPVLETALQDEFSVRCRAIVSLGEIRDLAALPAVLAMLRDPLPEVRYQATVALGELGHKNGLGALEPLLEDENAMVRRGAAKALEKLGDPRGEKLHEIAAAPPKKRRARRSGPGWWTVLVPDTVRELLWPDSRNGRLASVGTVLLVVVASVFGGRWLLSGGSGPAVTAAAKVGALGFNSDGTKLAIGRRFNEVEVWDVETGRRLAKMPGHADRAIGFAATSRGLVGAGNSTLSVWTDYADPGKPTVIPANTKNLVGMDLATTGSHAVTLVGDGTIVRWELETGQAAGAVRLPEATKGVSAALPDASGVVGIGPTGDVTCWDLPSGRTRFRIPTQVKPVTALAVSPDRKLVAVGGGRGHVELLGIDQKQVLVQIAPTLFGAVGNIVFRPDSQGMIVQKGPVLEHYDAKGTLVATISIAEAERIDAVAISPTGTLVAVGGHDDSTVWLYDLKTARFVRELLGEKPDGGR